MKSDRPANRTFATLRFAADDLDPDGMTKLLGRSPSFAQRLGRPFRHGPRSPEQMGRTGVWFLSTNGIVSVDALAAHVDYLVGLLASDRDALSCDARFQSVLSFVESEGLEVRASCFWAGRRDETAPAIPSVFTEAIARLHGTTEIAFDHDLSSTSDAEPVLHANVG